MDFTENLEFFSRSRCVNFDFHAVLMFVIIGDLTAFGAFLLPCRALCRNFAIA